MSRRFLLLLAFIAITSLHLSTEARALQALTPSDATQAETAHGMKLEDRTQQLGPFSVREKQFTVTLHEKHIVDSTSGDPGMITTLTSMEIKDAEGAIHFSETFPFDLSGGEFAESLSVVVEPLQGKVRNGLLLTFNYLPSTPLGGHSWQVFGMLDDRLVPFSKPIFAEGSLVNAPEGGVDASTQGDVIKTELLPGLQNEGLSFRVWTGNFFVIYPVKLDFATATAEPAWTCFKMTPGGQVPWCQYRVEADREEVDSDGAIVRLHPQASDAGDVPVRVVLTQATQIEVLAAEGDVEWQEDERGVSLNPGSDFWLKIRIDMNEGWIHSQEDLEAIGLPQAD